MDQTTREKPDSNLYVEKRPYTHPEWEVLLFHREDIVTLSPKPCEDTDPWGILY